MQNSQILKSIRNNKSIYIINTIVSIFFLLPFIWTLSTSLKRARDITAYPPKWIPPVFTLEHYKQIWEFKDGIFTTYFFNSVVLALCTTVLVVSISALAGYGFSKLKIPFHKVFFLLILSSLMIPFHSLLIPLFSILKTFHLLNTHMALIIIYVTFQLPFGVYMMTNAFNTVPTSLREAALIDGAGELKAFLRVMLPLVWPGIATIAIYSTYTTWNDFIVAVVFGMSDHTKTLNVGLTNLAVGEYGTNWGLLTSGSIIGFIPILILFLFLQKYFIKGLTSGSVK